MSSSTIGLARLPRALRDLLDEQAGTLSAAATALETLTRDPRRGAAIAEIVRLEDECDRVTHDIQHALPTARIASPERGELLHLTQTLDDIIDLVESVAHELPHLTAVLPHDSVARAGATLRTSCAPPAPPSSASSSHRRPANRYTPAHTSSPTSCASSCARRTHNLVETHDDVVPNVRAGALLRHLREIGHACTRALLAVEMLAGTHP